MSDPQGPTGLFNAPGKQSFATGGCRLAQLRVFDFRRFWSVSRKNIANPNQDGAGTDESKDGAGVEET